MIVRRCSHIPRAPRARPRIIIADRCQRRCPHCCHRSHCCADSAAILVTAATITATDVNTAAAATVVAAAVIAAAIVAVVTVVCRHRCCRCRLPLQSPSPLLLLSPSQLPSSSPSSLPPNHLRRHKTNALVYCCEEIEHQRSAPDLRANQKTLLRCTAVPTLELPPSRHRVSDDVGSVRVAMEWVSSGHGR